MAHHKIEKTARLPLPKHADRREATALDLADAYGIDVAVRLHRDVDPVQDPG